MLLNLPQPSFHQCQIFFVLTFQPFFGFGVVPLHLFLDVFVHGSQHGIVDRAASPILYSLSVCCRLMISLNYSSLRTSLSFHSCNSASIFLRFYTYKLSCFSKSETIFLLSSESTGMGVGPESYHLERLGIVADVFFNSLSSILAAGDWPFMLSLRFTVEKGSVGDSTSDWKLIREFNKILTV